MSFSMVVGNPAQKIQFPDPSGLWNAVATLNLHRRCKGQHTPISAPTQHPQAQSKVFLKPSLLRRTHRHISVLLSRNIHEFPLSQPPALSLQTIPCLAMLLFACAFGVHIYLLISFDKSCPLNCDNTRMWFTMQGSSETPTSTVWALRVLWTSRTDHFPAFSHMFLAGMLSLSKLCLLWPEMYCKIEE